ncbi:eukaryotic translation initiation factor 3 subunit L-like [Belonocnema kinseyi]|uniref:eukaryotic translation initiation factor 3 subunit L-like n=1 Tax=Belonocnema kinseyi TaxID=2817044 RepID=UPI00143DF43B|nr:eukaryotic translation initiation factor 3 subunit L-like [Belonocnema kinseyi]
MSNGPKTKEEPPQVSEVVQKFIQRFQKSLKSESASSTQTLYKYISDKLVLCESSAIAELVEHEKFFLMLYEQIYYRQVHNSKKPPTLNQRIKSFGNYQNLFHNFLEQKASLKLILPDQWLWDIVDEFVSQYESFSHYRENLKNKREDEIESLKANENLWDLLYVLETLFKLLNAAKTVIKYKTPLPSRLLYIKLGHFAIYGLLRVHTLQADYLNAIKILDERRLFPTKMSKTVFSSIAGCQFSVAYHASFSYVMMRRYVDAIDIIVNTLDHFQKSIQVFNEQSYQNDKIRKYVKKMLNLLCICFVLRHILQTVTHFYISKNVINKLMKGNKCDKRINTLEDQLDKMHRPEFKSCFLESSPGFVLPKAPNLEELGEDHSKVATEYQLSIFMNELTYHHLIPFVRFEMFAEYASGKYIYLLPFVKDFVLWEVMDQANVDFSEIQASLERPSDVLKAEGIKHFLRIKHKLTNAVRTVDPMSSGLDCTLETSSGNDFYIDRGAIEVIGDAFFEREED